MNFERKGLKRKSRTGDVCRIETRHALSVPRKSKCGPVNQSGRNWNEKPDPAQQGYAQGNIYNQKPETV